jgi:hypothetical protein
MKKVIVLFMLVCFTLPGIAQVSLFKPVPKDLFTSGIVPGKYLAAGEMPSKWLWRLSALVTADELVWDKTAKQFNSAPLSSVGPAIGFRHYTMLADGTPYNNYGFNAALLLGTNINQINPATMKFALTVNAFEFVNIGGAYTLNTPANLSPWRILLGASINF